MLHKADLSNYRFDFGAIFDNSECRGWYTEYLRKVKCEESILFVEAVEKYESLKSDKNRFVEAKKIVDEFIKPTTAHEINIDDEVRTSIMHHFAAHEKAVTAENCPRNLFENVAYKIYSDLKSDTFKRFLESDTFYNHLASKLKKDPHFIEEIAKENSSGCSTPSTSSGNFGAASTALFHKDAYVQHASKKTREAIASSVIPLENVVDKLPKEEEHDTRSEDKSTDLSGELAKLDQLFSIDKLLGSTPSITQADFEKLEHLTLGGEELWKCITKKPDRGLYTSKKKFSFGGSNRKIKAYKETGIVPFAAEHVIKLLSDKQLLFYTEPLLAQNDPLDYIPYDKTKTPDVFPMAIVYMKFKFAPPLQKRDFLFSISTVYDEKRKRYFSARKTCEHPKFSMADSKKNKAVRATYFGGLCVEEIDSFTSRYTVAAVVDMAGWIPLPLWNQLIGLRDDTFHNGLLKGLEMKKQRGTLDKVEDNSLRTFDTIEDNRLRSMSL